jgi:hypothetical protein
MKRQALTLEELKAVITPVITKLDEVDAVLRGLHAQTKEVERRLDEVDYWAHEETKRRAIMAESLNIVRDMVLEIHARMIEESDRVGARLTAVERRNGGQSGR